MEIKSYIALLSLLTIGACPKVQAQNVLQGEPPYPIQKTLTVYHGAVVSAHPLASQAGVHILERGGNAVDAAITTQLVLAVVFPGAGNIGGGGFMVAHLTGGRSLAIDYRETAPGKASRDMYIDSSGKARTDWSQNGHLACGVPGTIAGMFTAHRYGHLPFADLIQPAIDLAENGFVLTANEADELNRSNCFRKGPAVEGRRHPYSEGPGRYLKKGAGFWREGIL